MGENTLSATGSEMLCAVGVTFNLAMAIRRRLRDRGYFSATRPEPDLKEALDLVALGTVADVVPLVGENRVLVHGGLKMLRMGKRAGMRALLQVAGVNGLDVAASDLGFQLGPRINAAGRLGDAMQGVKLLKSEGEAAAQLAAVLDAENRSRRDIEKKIVEDAIRQVEQSALLRSAKAIVVADDSWHPGVVGIVASRLVDRFGRPAVVIGQGGRGSGRSIERYHLYDGLRAVKAEIGDALAGFGGHAHAAGVRVAAGGIDRFRDALLNHADAALSPTDLRKVAVHDGLLPGDGFIACFIADRLRKTGERAGAVGLRGIGGRHLRKRRLRHSNRSDERQFHQRMFPKHHLLPWPFRLSAEYSLQNCCHHDMRCPMIAIKIQTVRTLFAPGCGQLS